LLASGHWWGPEQVKPRGPSEYLATVHAFCESGSGTVDVWTPRPDRERSPQAGLAPEVAWPVVLDPDGVAARRQAAVWVLDALDADSPAAHPQCDRIARTQDERALVASWDRDLAVLLEEAQRDHHVRSDVAVPTVLSASALVRLVRDPDGLASDLARPMPRPPAPAARRGTRFHTWVESLFGVRPLIDRLELDGAADHALAGPDSLAALRSAFLQGPYASAVPYRIEAPFQIVLAGRIIRGRIDAVYRTDRGYEIVDWKTGSAAADPLQLAIYRLAWARACGVPESDVEASFYYVMTGRVEHPGDLPGAEAIEAYLTGSDPPR
jgi:DNA helicase II / ATP-dependent DNA helicase PcrA